MLFPISASIATMLLGSMRGLICLRRLLEDVGDGDAPNAVSKSDSLRGVELPPAMGRNLSGGDFGSIEKEKYRKEQIAMSATREVASTKCTHIAHAFAM